MGLAEMMSDWLGRLSDAVQTDADAAPLEQARGLVTPELEAALARKGRSVDDVLKVLAGAGCLTWLQTPGGRARSDIEGVARELTARFEADETPKFAVAVLNVDREGTVGPGEFGGWEVWLPNADELASLAPAPLIARSAWSHVWPFDTDLHTRVVLLRSVPELTRMPRGVVITFDWRRAPWIDAWRPLLLFNVFVPDAVVHATQHGTVYHGYAVHLQGEIPTEPYSHDGETYEERPLTSPWTENDGTGGDFGRFAQLLDDMIGRLTGPNQRLLEQAAKRFLTASAACWPDAQVPPDLEGQVVADYVSVLESLTVRERDLIAHKTAQHVALLCADEREDDRVQIFQLVKKAYGARSRYAHGDEVTDLSDLRELRRLVQQTLVRFIVAAAADTAGGPLPEKLPTAVLSPSYRREIIDEPAAMFHNALVGPA